MALPQAFKDLVNLPEFASQRLVGDCESIAKSLNNANQRGLVPISELSAVCVKIGLTGWLEFKLLQLANKASPTANDEQLGVACARAIAILKDTYRLTYADVDDVDFQAALTTFVTLGWITALHKTTITALGANRVGRAEKVLLRSCTVDDVAQVLREAN